MSNSNQLTEAQRLTKRAQSAAVSAGRLADRAAEATQREQESERLKRSYERRVHRLIQKRDRRINRLGRKLCAADRKLEALAAEWTRRPGWTDALWRRRMNNRWADAAGRRSAIAAELMRLGGW